jgi:predicted ATPase/DNA-binding SARP family transcriptional activator
MTRRLDELNAGETRSTLPDRPTRLIGRDSLLAQLFERLRSARLISLLGAGGIGKSRLALEVAHSSSALVWWVPLADVAPGGDVVAPVSRAIGIAAHDAESLAQGILHASQHRPGLLVLDNCEHVLDGAASLVRAVLSAAPAVSVLCTSREALDVAGEVRWTVPPLATAASNDSITGAGLESPAMALFLDRARDARATVAVTPATAPLITHICERLDGVPLAIELAAAMLRVLSVEEIAQRVDDALRLLRNGPRFLPERHRALEATFAWSWTQLSHEERVVLRSLAVFRGGFSLDAVEHVGRSVLGDQADDPLSVLARLVDRSLVVLDERGDEVRYRLLEPTRQFAERRLHEAAAVPVARAAHADWVVAFARAIAAPFGEPGWFPTERAIREQGNIQAAVEFLAVTPDRGRDAVAVLDDVWIAFTLTRDRAPLARLSRTIVDAIHRDGLTGEPLHRAQMIAAYFLMWAGELSEGAAFAQDAVAGARSIGNGLLLARALDALAWCSVDHPVAAHAASEESFALLPAIDNRLYRAILLLSTPSLIAVAQQSWDVAESRYEQAEREWSALGIPWGMALARSGLASVAAARERWALAARLAHSVLDDVGTDGGSPLWTSLGILGRAAVGSGDVSLGVQLLAAHQAIRERNGGVPTAWEQQLIGAIIAESRARAGDADFTRWWGDGLALSPAEALSLAYRVPTATAEFRVVSDAPQVFDHDRAHGPLTVALLGPLIVTTAAGVLARDRWPYAKPRELLAYLTCHPEGRTREQIGLALWPELSTSQVKNNLHVTLHHLRRALGHARFVVFAGARYRLSSDVGVETDIEQFDVAQRKKDWPTIVSLWRGEFCESEGFGSWAETERDRLRVAYLDAIMAAADAAERAGDADEAVAYFQRALHEDAEWEEAREGLARTLDSAGHRAEARRVRQRATRDDR